MLTPPGAEADTNHESDDHAWVQVEELDGYDVDPGTVRMASAGIRLLRAHPELR